MVLLWDIIREFYVRYIFGGTIWNSLEGNYEYFGGVVGSTVDTSGPDYVLDFTQGFFLPIDAFSDSTESVIQYICMGDWLSTTATIITLVALLVGISYLMVSLFRWIVRLVSLRG